MSTTPDTYSIITSRSVLRRGAYLGAVTLGAVTSAAGSATFVDTAQRATHADATLLWSLVALLAAALTACLIHLLLTLTLTALIEHFGTHTLVGSSLLALLKVVAPRAGRRIMIAGTTAGCAVALAASPGYAQSPAPIPAIATASSASAAADSSAPSTAPLSALGWAATTPQDSTRGAENHEAARENAPAPLQGLGWADAAAPAAPSNTAKASTAKASTAKASTAAQDAPRAVTVTVRPGDTLWSISHTYLASTDQGTQTADVSRYVTRVITANPSLNNPDLIQPGEHITLPAPGR